MEFERPSALGDVVFTVENKKIYANEAILSSSSPVFHGFLNYRTPSSKSSGDISLRWIKFDTAILFMRALHPPFLEINDTHVDSLLPLAYLYMVQRVVDQCESVLMKRQPSVQILYLADKHRLPKLRHHCLTHLSRTVSLDNLLHGKDYADVNSDTLIEIVRMHVKNNQEAQEAPEEILRDLMSKPPSVKSLVLAEKYNLAELRETCIQYAKKTPLRALIKEPGYKDIRDATLNEILTHKVQKWEKAGSLKDRKRRYILLDLDVWIEAPHSKCLKLKDMCQQPNPSD